MADTFKDYDIVLAEEAEKDKDKTPPSFKLGGETFICKRKLGGKAAIALGKIAEGGDTQTLLDFIYLSLRKADHGRFDAVLDADDDGAYDVPLYGQIVTDIVEGYTGRFTAES